MCKPGNFVYAVQSKTAPGRFNITDDTALEGFKFVCRNPCASNFTVPTNFDAPGNDVHIAGETVGGNGVWDPVEWDPVNFIVGVVGEGVPPVGFRDDRGMVCAHFYT